MTVRELALALSQCQDQDARVFFGETEIAGCDEIIWSEGANDFVGKVMGNRVLLTEDIDYDLEEVDYGKTA